MTAPYPYQPKPSIVDRVAARLFPAGGYQGLLAPEDVQGLQHQGLMQIGLNLVNASGSAPYQRGLLPNLAASIQGAQLNYPQMAQQALQLQAYKGQQQEQALLAAAAARHPA